MSADDSHEQFITCLTKQEPELRAFVRSLLPTWDGVDEVMQNVALVAWRKFNDFDPTTDFIRWACVIARYEVLNYRRGRARDRLEFSPEVYDRLATEGLEELGRREQERRALQDCLDRLPPQRRRLLTDAYTPGIKIKDLAAAAGQTPGSLYVLLNRLRGTLLDCIRRRLAIEGVAS